MHLRVLFLSLIVFSSFLVRAADTIPPVIQGVSPAGGATISNLTQVTVTFSEPVTGVEAADFLINGNPANTRAGLSNAWTFTFSQPFAGTVSFAWDASHAIYDLAGNRFDELGAGAIWSLMLVDTVAPVVASVFPTPGAVVGALTQLQVTFREAVAGVDAADLTINGQPATSVSGAGAGPYLFTFAQPLNGTVTMNWSASHGIADLAPSPNPFNAGSWTYTLDPAAAADVVLNEIMAENLNGLLDEDGDTSDWIELFNRGGSPVNLLGWSLTDDPAQPGQWVFPAVTLGAGQYLLVWASGKDRATTTGTNHASFVLGGSEYLGLYDARFPRQVVSEFAPSYPEQRADISWGRARSNTFAYFATATPRATNSIATNYAGFAERPHASVGSGLFTQPFNLHLGSDTAGASIYYTLNGSVPSPTNGALFTGPIAIAGSSNKAVIPLRAAAYKAGLLPSSVETRTYVFPDFVIYQPISPAGFPTQWVSEYTGASTDTVGDYEMDPQVLTNNNNAQIARAALRQLPVVSLVTSVSIAFGPTNGVYSGRRKSGNQRPVNVEMWLPDGRGVFQADCGWEIQGGSSPTDSGSDWKDKKLSQRLVFKGDFGTPKLQARVFDDTPVEEFDTLILDAGLNYWWTHMTDSDQRNRAKFITDTLTSDLMNNAGMVAQHARYVHLYLDGLYWGVYFLHERMDESAAASYFGGAKEEWDVLKHSGDLGGLQNGTVTNYTAMLGVARSGVANNAVYERLQAFLDLPWFIDYMIVNFWVGNTDWPNHNFYAWRRSRTPGSLPWRFVNWDAEHTFKQWDYDPLANGSLATPNSPGELFQLLTNNVEFRVAFGDHIHKLMFNGGPLYTLPNTAALWSPTNASVNLPATAYRKRVDEIWDSIVCESARWGDVSSASINNPYTRELHYARELNSLFNLTNTPGQTVNYFPLRGSNILSRFRSYGLYPYVAAPIFSQHGGRVAAGFSLSITNTNAASVVYFTTNGVDPRAYGSGGVSPQAAAYSGSPVTLGQSTVVKARALANSTNWSALNEAVFTVGTFDVPLRLTEIMYNPMGGGAYEFLELLNTGPIDLPLGGYSFEGITFSFPKFYSLPAGARIVLASDANPVAFAARYAGTVVAGYFSGSLNNGGQRIAIKDAGGNTVLSVNYRDDHGWPVAADGGGYSLEIIDTDGNPDDPANWRPSSTVNGTPGLASVAPPAPAIVLNEIMAENLTTTNHGGAYPDWIELYNPSASPVNLTGWSLSDNPDSPGHRFVFTNGPTVGSGGYLLIWCDTNSAAPGLHTGFGLDKDGGDVFLYDASTNRVDAIGFGRQIADYSLNRITYPSNTWVLNAPTPGRANSLPPLPFGSSLLINEWLANAPPGQSDWIELYSPSFRVGLKGIRIAVGDTIFRYPALSFVEPGGFVRLFADEQPGPGHIDLRLPSSGGSIVLYDPYGNEMDRITYAPQAQGVTSGRYPNGSATIVAFPASASPAASNYVITYTGPVLNEVMARNQSTLAGPAGNYPDWIELFNPNPFPTNIGGMSLAQSAGGAARWVIPAGTTLDANGYFVIFCDGGRPASSSATIPLNTGFSLSADSGGLHLFNAAGQLVNQVEFGFQIVDHTIGLSGGQWKLLVSPTPGAANSAAAPLAAATGLRLNEWMPNPARGNDWFELFNTNPDPVDLSGLFLSDDPSLNGGTHFQVAPLSFIAGRGWVKFIADGDPSQGREHVNFNPEHLGDSLRLFDTNLALIDAVDFGALSAGVSQGRLPDGGSNIVSFVLAPSLRSPGQFVKSSTRSNILNSILTPTPAGANYLPLANIVINEVLSHTDPPLEDAVELANVSGFDTGVGGWFLSDSDSNLKKYRIADGTTIAAGGFHVFTQDQFGTNTDPGALEPFTFDGAHGGAIYLSAADGAGNLTGYRSQFTFGAAASGVSFGRVVTSVGTDLPAAMARSFGSSNPPPLVGPVVINEIMYHPVASGAGNESAEFIELHNTTTSPVALYDPANSANTWRLSGGVQFSFPGGVSIPSRGYLLLVNFDPASDPAALANFRGLYGVPAGVPILGPYDGKLDNGGDVVELHRPDLPRTSPPDAGFVPQVLVDRVEYADSLPWPAEAAGTGSSLQRRRPYNYGNEPVNWKSEPPTAGRANVPGGTYTDTDRDGLPDDWENAHNLGANNPSDAAADPDGDGHSNYEEFLDGTDPQNAASRLDAPAITAQPQNQVVLLGSNATFSVIASGTAPLRYQWRFNNLPIAGATDDTLVVADAQFPSAGTYSVAVLNGAGFALSQGASLVVNQPPVITTQPTNQFVLPGTNVSFVVVATGSGVVRYQWLFNGSPIPGATDPTFTIPSASLASEGDYAVLVTNAIATVSSQIVRLIVKVPPRILVPPATRTNAVGATTTFTVRVSGSVPMTYIWRRGSAIILTSTLLTTNGSLTLTNMSLSDSNFYRVSITNYAYSGQLTNVVFTNAVWPATAITTQPTNRTVYAGGTTSFSLVATSLNLTYQWRLDGAPIANATNATLTLTDIQPAQAGGYSALVANIVGSVTSQTATLTVLVRPILTEPEYVANGLMRFKLLGDSNQSYFIEVSTNLVDWPTLTNLLTTNALMPFVDGPSPGVPRRFYRARLAP